MDFYEALERLGFTKTQTEKRIKIYKKVAESSTLYLRQFSNVDIIIPGSRGEGNGIWNESDIDIIYVERCVNCSDSCTGVGGKTDASVIFQLDFENVESGYAMLRLVSTAYTRTNKELITNIKSGLVQRHGYEYLRNDQKFTPVFDHHRKGFAKQQFVFDDIRGPARTVICEFPFLDNISVDRVLAFPCTYPSVLDTWCRRERIYNWPNKDLIAKVKDLDVFVVPVGVKGSVNEVLQWRISVTLTEQKLVHSFSDTQIKLYTAMKMLAKHELNPVCDNISSYIVKHLTFWMFEETRIENFNKEDFNDILLQLLQRFKICVTWRYLPNYMFPDRNMLKTKIFEKERIELIRRLDAMIEEGPEVLLRCPLVREVIDLQKEISQNKIIFSELVEEVVLAMFCIPQLHLEKLMKEKVIHRAIFHLPKEKIVKIIMKHGIPLIRRYNPYGYFKHISRMSNEEINYRLFSRSFALLQ